MGQTQAWELLNNPEYSGRLNMDGLYKLMRRARYSEEFAREVAKQRGWDRLNDGEVM